MKRTRYFPATYPLPDWRNFGVMLRVLLGVNLLAALGALVQAPDLRAWGERFIDLAAIVQPLLLMCLGVLSLLRDALWRLRLRHGQACVLALTAVIAGVMHAYAASLGLVDGALSRSILLTLATTGLLLAYFELRSRALSPAQAEARLAALNARIRPHFLFNSLNAVLSLIRAQPQQAEAALESLSDLFRAAMRDPAALVSLADEVALGRQYVELERLRLGERLSVDWQVDEAALGLSIPPMMLQPLLENAVYHGVEPAASGGVVSVDIRRCREELHVRIANPTADQSAHAAGNHMALSNIRERLALYYDLEARLETEAGDNSYEVRIVLPCQRKPR